MELSITHVMRNANWAFFPEVQQDQGDHVLTTRKYIGLDQRHLCAIPEEKGLKFPSLEGSITSPGASSKCRLPL
jgi:hypothetical protein